MKSLILSLVFVLVLGAGMSITPISDTHRPLVSYEDINPFDFGDYDAD